MGRYLDLLKGRMGQRVEAGVDQGVDSRDEDFCPACGSENPPPEGAAKSGAWAVCHAHRKLPTYLVKAMVDEFDYAVRLRTGEAIRFSSAEMLAGGEFVRLVGHGMDGGCDVEGLPYPCPRGVEVRLSDIVWVTDAPQGS